MSEFSNQKNQYLSVCLSPHIYIDPIKMFFFELHKCVDNYKCIKRYKEASSLCLNNVYEKKMAIILLFVSLAVTVSYSPESNIE